MSTEVENRIVEMQFNNDRFERNVATTMSTLDKLKAKLNFSGVSKGFEDVSSAAEKVNMTGLGRGVESVMSRFSALEVIGVTALANIANSAVNAGKRMLSALTVDPIKTGFSEYETQINAIQTILANTESKGTTLDNVNEALDTLNAYADKTIYNFTEMTRNIGTFTAAGIDLETSVNSIQGIANLAAVSGSTSQQASTAMYQLSQALASGTVKLMDWNSVVNAGMGGQVFQDALKETARVHGVAIDEMIESEGSFRETLKNEWLTADILNETLEKFTMTTEGLTDAEIEANREKLRSIGYTDEQIEGIFRLGNTATNAATKVKTFTQLWDTLKESAQSGWTQTWEIIVGDFEEAKTLLTRISDVIGGILNESAQARNELLMGWKEGGGRNDLIETFEILFEAVMNVSGAIKGAFEEIFPPLTVEQLLKFTSGMKELASKLNPSAETLDKIRRVFKGFFAVLDIGRGILVAAFNAIKPLFGGLDDLGGGILDVAASFGDWLVRLNESIKESGLFVKVVEGIHAALAPVVSWMKDFASAVGEAFSGLSDTASKRLGPLTAIGTVIKNIFVGIGNVLKKVAPFIHSAATGIGNVLRDVMDTIAASVQNANFDSFFDLVSGGIMTTIGVFIAKFFKSGSGILDGANGFLENINGILEGVGDALGAFTDSIKAETLKKIATAIAILAAALLVLSLIDSEKLTSSLVAVTVLFGELMGAMSLFTKIIDGKGILSITMTSKALTRLASAMLILAIAMKIMSTMSWSEMGVGLISLTVGLGALVGAVNLLPEKKITGAAKAIQKMSGAILILAVAIKLMSTMSWSEMGVGLISMVVGLGAMVGAVNLLPKDTAKRAAGMIGLATAMVILGAALKIMGSMSWGELAVGLVALAGSLAILAGAMALMKNGIPGALAMMMIAPALIVLAGALKIMSDMSWEEIARGLLALAGALAVVAAAMHLMTGALPGAAALVVVSGALAILAPVMKTLGSMSWGEIARGLVAIAGAFAILGIAGLVLGPLTPVILSLAGAIALLGVGCTLVGVGVLALGVGLGAIAAAGTAAGAALISIVAGLISLIPYFIEQVGVGIIKLCEVIAGSASAICDAVTVIVVSLVDALVASVPALVDGALVLLTAILESLVEYLPQIGDLLCDLLIKLMDLLAKNMPKLAESAVRLLVAVIDAIAANIGTLVEPLLNLLEIIFQGIADIIGPIVETVIAPILEVLTDLIVGLAEEIAPYIPNIQAMVEAICNAFVYLLEQVTPVIRAVIDLVRQLADSISQILQSIVDVVVAVGVVIQIALQGLADVFDSIFSGITTVVTSVGDSIRTVLEGISGTIDSVAGVIEESLGGLSDIFDSVFNGISTVLTSVGDSIKSVLDGIAGVIESIGVAALDAGTGFNNLANGIKTITDLKLADMVASLAAVAKGITDIARNSGKLETVGNGMSRLSNAIRSIGAEFGVILDRTAVLSVAMMSMNSTLKTLISTFTIAGTTMVTKMLAGITSSTATLPTAGKTMVTSVVIVLTNAYSDFRAAGAYVVDGFAAGITTRTWYAEARAKAMAQAALRAAKETLDEHSPSKEFYKVGAFAGAGFVNAFVDYESIAFGAGSRMAEAATTGLNQTVSRISDIIDGDIDVQPVIRPVLDLSDVRSGANSINGMLGLRPSIGVLSTAGSISASMNARGQNGFNDDVVSAINKLGNSLGNTGNTYYTIDGVTYDDGSSIADAVKSIARAAIRERRV